jgi:superfamily II DNA or RNA helicase
MEPGTKQLRAYQVRLVTDVCRTSEDVLVEQPTGSGKTVQIVTLVAMHLGRRFSHALISAPQEQIEHGFVKRDSRNIAFPASLGVAQPSLAVPEKLIRGARISMLGSVKQIAAYLRQPVPLDYALACTHAALNQLTPEKLPDDLSSKALFIDEAHHASADGLSQLVALWRERGGQLFFFTATPYRGDGRNVRLEGMRAFRRSLAEHMAEGFAPRHLESEIVALGQPGDAITAAQFTGEEAPPSSYFDGLIAAIVCRWSVDGKPRAIVRVPPMQGGQSGELVSRLMTAFSSQGARVLDATGTSATDKQRFLRALEAEKSRTYATSGFDVMLGIQRVLEGTDWPVCSAVYCVGMPGSLNTVVQFLGRAMRLKDADYPAEQRDRARLVFFVPCGGGAALADLSLDHSRHALLTCCFLADHEVGQEWIVLREVRRGIEAALGNRVENPAAAAAENEADEPLDLEVRAEVELVMASAREQIISNGGEPTVGEVVKLAAKMRSDLPEAALQRVAVEILAVQTTDNGEAVRGAIQTEIARRLRIDPRVKQAMTEAFAVVLAEFRDVTLSDSAVLQSVGRQVHGVTGGQMREFAERLRVAAPRPLSVELILAWADEHYQRTGDWPSIGSGPVNVAPGETWNALDAALDQGHRGLPGGSSVAKLLAEHRGRRNQKNQPALTVEQILIWADAHKQRTDSWPTKKSGTIAEAPAEDWGNVDAALSQGRRSLPGDSSLPQLLNEHRNVRNIRDLPMLTIEQILEWADAHHERTAQWPKQNSGSVADAPGETWMSINGALQQGRRGLPGGSSLAQLLDEKRGVRNPKALADLTEEQILAWSDAHHELTGEWPNRETGPVEGAPGETWTGIKVALSQGRRGLPGGSSLAQLLQEKRGVRNPGALPDLTEDQILLWAEAHRNRTGKIPNKDSGYVDEVPDEKWANLDAALRTGSRGLPGGSSLAQLFAKNMGVRNKQALPKLTVHQILAWCDAHKELKGEWPSADSGPIESAPGETWTAVHIALSRGTRGLQGGSSLAKLLAKERGVRNIHDLPDLDKEQLLAWIAFHKEQTGEWPNHESGPVINAPDETWTAINRYLRVGIRGLPGGSSLARLVEEYRDNSLK